MSQDDRLAAAAARAKELPQQPNDVLLQLYGLYKQATQGDVTSDRPSLFDPVGRAKFDAWSQRRGMSKEEAVQAYVELVDKLAQ